MTDMQRMRDAANSPEGAQEWLSMLQNLAEQIQKQQQTSQQMVQESMSTYAQLFNIPLSYAQEGLQSSQFPIEGYDELTVDEVSRHINALSSEQLRTVRDYEERNKNRDTILEQLDRKIR